MSDWTITANPKTIKNELESFYSNLYSEENSGHWSSFLDNLKELPPLTEELQNLCEGKIEYNECFKVFQSFQTNKTPGNDGLTISNSFQKQAIITLMEKKGKDKRLINKWLPISLINVDTKIISKVSANRLLSTKSTSHNINYNHYPNH